jgi:hypothetical protein
VLGASKVRPHGISGENLVEADAHSILKVTLNLDPPPLINSPVIAVDSTEVRGEDTSGVCDRVLQVLCFYCH